MASKRKHSRKARNASSGVETYLLTAGKPHRDCPICQALGLIKDDDADEGVWMSVYDPDSDKGTEIRQAMSALACKDMDAERRN